MCVCAHGIRYVMCVCFIIIQNQKLYYKKKKKEIPGNPLLKNADIIFWESEPLL